MVDLFAGPVVIFCAHSDDEALSCGGLVQRLVERGVDVYVQWMTFGVPQRPGYGTDDITQISLHREEGRHEALERLGLKPKNCGYVFNYRTSELDGVLLIELTRRIEAFLREVKPATVLTHWYGDPAQDHRRVTEAVTIATRPKPGNPTVNLLMYETLSNSEWTNGVAFTPNVFVAITAEHVQKKIDALAAYDTELMEWPHPRSSKGIVSLAATRGMQVGSHFAEAYLLVRSIVK